MTTFVRKYTVNVGVILLFAYAFESVGYRTIAAVLIGAFLLMLLNLTIKPILLILTLPATLITLGLFTFIVNAIVIEILDSLMRGLYLGDFGHAILMALAITLANIFIKESFEK